MTLYAAGTGGSGSAPSVLATTKGFTNGTFYLSFILPTPVPAPLYVVATGGDARGGANSAIKLMAAIGMSNAVPKGTIVINELTTVGSAYPLNQFADLTTPENLGTSSTNHLGLINAMAVTSNLFSLQSGALASFLANSSACTGGSPPANCATEEKLDTLADIVAACVRTAGPSGAFPADCSTLVGDSPACDQLLCYTNTNDTLQAVLAMARAPEAVNPSTGRTLPFTLATPASPFQPILSATPNDLTLSLSYATGFSGARIAINSVGNVWFSGTNTFGELAPNGTLISPTAGFLGNGTITSPEGLAIDAALSVWIPNSAGVLTELRHNRSFAANYSGGGLSGSQTAAIDSFGNVWIANKSSDAVVKISPSGAFFSGADGFTGGGLANPKGLALDGFDNAWVGNDNGTVTELDLNGNPVGATPFSGGGLSNTDQLAIDPYGDAWAANQGNDSISELDPTGVPISGVNGFTGGGLSAPSGIAIDAIGHVFVSDRRSGVGIAISEFDSGGNPLSPNTGFSGSG